jgi:Ala-tRNA(Pro) deacylase
MTPLDISSALDHELIPHRHTETALDEAASLGLPPVEIAKTIILHVAVRGDLTIGATWARAVLPATERLDRQKLRTFFGESRDVRLATEPELAEFYPEFELGAVPPLGGRGGDIVIVDPRLAERESIVFEAGTHDQSVRMKTVDLLASTRATIVDICQAPAR